MATWKQHITTINDIICAYTVVGYTLLEGRIDIKDGDEKSADR